MLAGGAPQVVAVHFADPWSVWSWGLEPVVNRVKILYGSQVRIEFRMGGAIERLDDWRQRMKLEGPALVEWLKESMRKTGNPADPECLTKGSFTSSFGACTAVTAAQLMDSGLADRYLRRLMEYLQVRGLPAEPRVLGQAARDVGLDEHRLQQKWGEPEVAHAFRAARTEMHRSGREFFDVEYRSLDGKSEVVSKQFHSAAHMGAIERLAPGLERRPLGSVLQYFQRRGDLISLREAAEVHGLSDSETQLEIEKLWKRGELERWTYGGAPFWTALRTRPH
ncbi:MAG TPA: DsbA family protein [Thermoplasmata archaeon]|nr:DsbA family protein [Thermoplasmata archaeon]